jgi:hypothetical protein
MMRVAPLLSNVIQKSGLVSYTGKEFGGTIQIGSGGHAGDKSPSSSNRGYDDPDPDDVWGFRRPATLISESI